MKILPAIDIFDGKCVRLVKGEFESKKIYSSDPLAVAKKFEQQGAKMLHVVDLNAAKIGKPVNQELILNITKAVGIPVEVGGGIRDIETARTYLNNGIQKIVVGTRAVNDLVFLSSLIQEFGRDRVIVGVETRKGKITINGWQETTNKDYLDFAKELKSLGVTEILFTDVGKDGTLTEPNFEAIQKLVGLGFKVIASGGISNIESIKKLKKIGTSAAILGKALYENKIVLGDALKEALPVSNLTKRIIPCLDVKDGKVVKGVRFRNHIIMGDIVELAKRYSDEGADELVFYDITASTEARTVSIDWVKKVAQVINIPFCVAGGINSVNDARKILQSGADKISINSPALENPNLVNSLVKEFGSQCVVVGIDSIEKNGDFFVKKYTGDPNKTKSTKWRTFDWALEVQKRGAGEIVLNCMNQDGTRKGYDLIQLKALGKLLTIPLIASGGAGSAEDFIKVFNETNVDAALAASIFHKGDISVRGLKKVLQKNNLQIRL
mgnify:CR=1 FL=1